MKSSDIVKLVAPLAAIVSMHTGYGPLHTRPKAFRTINKLNRSRHLPPVKSYEEARDARKALGSEDAKS
jgi:hypothetical protein